MFLCRPPRDPALARLVDTLWVQSEALPHPRERIVPSGRAQLLLNLGGDVLREHRLDGRLANETRGLAIQGLRTGPLVIDTSDQRHACGASLAHGAVRQLFGLPASELADQLVELDALWGIGARRMRDRVGEAPSLEAQLDALEAALLEIVARRSPDRRAIEACHRLARGEPVAAVVDRGGFTAATLIRHMREHIGVAPKLFSRILRFQSALRGVARSTSWAQLALEAGFADQAHLVREFRHFSGTSPSAYRPRTDAQNHIPLLDDPTARGA
ncbi:MAG: helix-turn-helix domain-containing protein [Sandaracinaceae bacterium]